MANFAQIKQPGQCFKRGQYEKISNFIQKVFEKVGLITIFFESLFILKINDFSVELFLYQNAIKIGNFRFHFSVLYNILIPFKYPESKIFQSES